jgi:hypothetical protein
MPFDLSYTLRKLSTKLFAREVEDLFRNSVVGTRWPLVLCQLIYSAGNKKRAENRMWFCMYLEWRKSEAGVFGSEAHVSIE